MYIIVGAGPAGLTLAYLLGKSGQRCVVVERESEIGGCHRVLRVDGLFTEHAPRVYLSSYLNTLQILERMGIQNVFTSYKFSILKTMLTLFRNFSIQEVLYLLFSFLSYVLRPFGKSISVADWCCHFSSQAKDALDRFCLFTDGAGSDRYSIEKLFQLANQNIFYSVLQPRLPTDVGLFPQMRYACEQTGYVSFYLSNTVEKVLVSNRRVTGVLLANGATLNCQSVLLCVPPPALHQILTASNLLVCYPGADQLLQTSTYARYLSCTFHYSRELDIQSQWGFPTGEWGVISNRVTDYMNLNDPRSVTVFSITCIYLDRVSSRLGQTLNQIADVQVVLEEIYQQLREMYPGLPAPEIRVLSPTAYYTAEEGWKERDSGYIHTVSDVHLKAAAEGVSGLYQIGTQNGESSFAYTTMEAAVTNAIEWYNTFREGKVVVRNPVPVRRVAWMVLLVGIFFALKRYLTHKK